MSEVITSPNGVYSVKLHDDFGEIGMGSPIYGTLTLQGAQRNLPDGFYGETILFSPDSRFVAVEFLALLLAPAKLQSQPGRAAR